MLRQHCTEVLALEQERVERKSQIPKISRMIRVEDELELDHLDLVNAETIGALIRESDLSKEEVAKKRAREFFESYEDANRANMLKELGKKEKAFTYLQSLVKRNDDDEIDCDEILMLPDCVDDTDDDRSTKMSSKMGEPVRHPDEKRVLPQDINNNTDQMFF